jgi:hypothetical protein
MSGKLYHLANKYILTLQKQQLQVLLKIFKTLIPYTKYLI